MRNGIHSETSPLPVVRDRKIFRSLLLAGAAVCAIMGVLRIEPNASSLANLAVRCGTQVVDPLMASIRRHSAW